MKRLFRHMALDGFVRKLSLTWHLSPILCRRKSSYWQVNTRQDSLLKPLEQFMSIYEIGHTVNPLRSNLHDQRLSGALVQPFALQKTKNGFMSIQHSTFKMPGSIRKCRHRKIKFLSRLKCLLIHQGWKDGSCFWKWS